MSKNCVECMHAQMCKWFDDMVGDNVCDWFRDWDEKQIGHWVEEPGNIPRCSICGTYSDDADREDGGYYCTHCGARMGVNDEIVN